MKSADIHPEEDVIVILNNMDNFYKYSIDLRKVEENAMVWVCLPKGPCARSLASSVVTLGGDSTFKSLFLV